MIELVEEFIINLGGKRKERNPFWNSTDDDPNMNYARWEIDVPQGVIHVCAAEKKPDVKWPDYPCAGDSFANKFSATMFTSNGVRTPITESFVDSTPANLQQYLGQFQGGKQ